MGLLLLFGMLVCCLKASDVRLNNARRMWIALLLACLAPIDVSLRYAGAPTLVLTANCELSGWMIELNRANQLICVADGRPLYSEPRWVLVW